MTTQQSTMTVATGETGAPEQRPVLVLRPENPWSFLPLTEVWQYRDLLVTLGIRDIKLRYRQTALGAIWVVLQPLLGAGIFQVVFGMLAKTPSDGAAPFVFYFSGFMAYKAFESTLNKASNCMVGNAHLVSKVYFPRLVLPLSTIGSTLVDFAVSCVMLAVLLLIYRVTPTFAILLLPLWVLLLQFLAIGIGLYLAALTVRYRDVQYAVPILIQFGLYASPVAYSVSLALGRLPESLHPLVFLNPITGLIDAFRWSILNTPVYSWGIVSYSVCTAIVVFILGVIAFTRMEKSFADII